MAWLLRQEKPLVEAVYTAWPPALPLDEEIYQEYYGDDWKEFATGKQIPCEAYDIIDEYYKTFEQSSEKRLVEKALTGGRYSIPDIKGIPWSVRELLKLTSMVDDCKTLEDRVKDLPSGASDEAIRKNAKAQTQAMESWQGILRYANNLDRFNRYCKETKRGQ